MYNIGIMFCPNCAAQNETAQHYCRMCGLKLDAIVTEMSMQKPSAEMAELLKKQRWMQKLGVFSFSTASFISLALLLTVAVYYKLLILGPVVLFGSALGAVILFLLASAFFFGYSKFFLKLNPSEAYFSKQKEISTPTDKLLDNPPLQPASVTEHSTELLHRK